MWMHIILYGDCRQSDDVCVYALLKEISKSCDVECSVCVHMRVCVYSLKVSAMCI